MMVKEPEIAAFVQHLREEEREQGTIEKYRRDMGSFMVWVGEREISRALTTAWKEHLKAQGYKPETIPGKLCRKLEKYAKKQKVASGELFVTRSGKGLTRRQIWAEMKGLCKAAGVEPSKVFPHNLGHLFARTFYHAGRDIAKLADVLGHSSIETTRIYLISTGVEHARQLNRLGLVS